MEAPGIEPGTFGSSARNSDHTGGLNRGVRRRGSHIIYTIGSQTAVRLSAPRAGRPLPPRRFVLLEIQN
jgi:hypothetical protein